MEEDKELIDKINPVKAKKTFLLVLKFIILLLILIMAFIFGGYSVCQYKSHGILTAELVCIIPADVQQDYCIDKDNTIYRFNGQRPLLIDWNESDNVDYNTDNR